MEASKYWGKLPNPRTAYEINNRIAEVDCIDFALKTMRHQHVYGPDDIEKIRVGLKRMMKNDHPRCIALSIRTQVIAELQAKCEEKGIVFCTEYVVEQYYNDDETKLFISTMAYPYWDFLEHDEVVIEQQNFQNEKSLADKSSKLKSHSQKGFELRSYQQEIISILKKKQQKSDGRFLVQLPTGMGKTVVFSELIRELSKKTLVVAHREELLFQAQNTIAQSLQCDKNEIDIVLQSKCDAEKEVWIASIQTLVRGNRLSQISPELIIIDEAHHSIAKSYQKIIKKFKKVPVIGFTATPTRRTKKEKRILGQVWDELVYQYPIKKAILDNWLAHIEYYQVKSDVCLNQIKTMAGDFQNDQLSETVNVYSRNIACLEKYHELGGGKCVVFCVNVKHAQEMEDVFRSGGVNVHCVTGQTPKEKRRAILSKFDNANMDQDIVLTNCLVLTEGWDCPDLKMVIMARPTQSEIVYLQQLGRGTRRTENKDRVIVVDIADNCQNKKICSCLTTVFNLHKNTLIEGDIVDYLVKQKGDQPETDTDPQAEQQKVALEILKILFDMPLELEKSSLAWFSPFEKEYYCQLGISSRLKIEDDLLAYRLYLDRELIIASDDLDRVLTLAKEIAGEYKDTKFMWDRSTRESMDNKPVTEKQYALLQRIAPNINPDLISRATASVVISACMTRRDKEPATEKQKRFLLSLGYEDVDDGLTKKEASKEIKRLLGRREWNEEYDGENPFSKSVSKTKFPTA